MRVKRIAALTAVLLAAPSSLLAQAWLFPKGQGAVTVAYQNTYVRQHLFSNGEEVDAGHIMGQGLLVDMDFTLGQRLAVKIGVPFLASRYSGPSPHRLSSWFGLSIPDVPGWRPLDDGSYHGTFQDLRVGLRYKLISQPLVVTPFFEAVLPSHKYVFFAHTAPGRDQREYHLGLNLGRRLNPFLPKAYIQARYSYAFVQPILGIAPNRSDSELQLGYFLTPRLSVMALSTVALAHSGISQVRVGWPFNLPPEQRLHHDQISRVGLFDVGGGAFYSLSRSVAIFGSLVTAVWGRNTHKLASGVTVGISWSIHPRFGGGNVATAALEDDSGRTVGTFRCACAASSAH